MSAMHLADFGTTFIGGQLLAGQDGRIRHAGAAGLSWFIPRDAHPVSITMIHGGGGQATDFITTPDGRPGWLHRFLAAGHPVWLLDRPGHGRAVWNEDHMGPTVPAADLAMMEARFMHPARAAQWPEAALHDQWPDGCDGVFMAGQGPMARTLAAAQVHAEAVAPDLFARVGPTVLLTHSAGAPCGWAMASHAAPGQIRAIVAAEPLGAPGMEHPLGRFPDALTVSPPGGPQDPFAAPIAVLTGEASWMGAANAALVDWLARDGRDVDHLRLAEHGLHGNGHMLMSERNSDAVADLILGWLADRI